MSRPILPYGFEAHHLEGRDTFRVGYWTVVSEVDWYQLRLDLSALGVNSDDWLELLITGHVGIYREGVSLLLRMWPVVGQRDGNLFLRLGSERYFRGGDPIEFPGRRVA